MREQIENALSTNGAIALAIKSKYPTIGVSIVESLQQRYNDYLTPWDIDGLTATEKNAKYKRAIAPLLDKYSTLETVLKPAFDEMEVKLYEIVELSNGNTRTDALTHTGSNTKLKTGTDTTKTKASSETNEKYNPVATANSKLSGVTEGESEAEDTLTHNTTDTESHSMTDSGTVKDDGKHEEIYDYKLDRWTAFKHAVTTLSPVVMFLNEFAVLWDKPEEFGDEYGGGWL